MSKEPDPRVEYADIIHLPHWQSPVRPPMSLHDRAAQFLSYKSLNGFEDLVAEEARITDEMTEMGGWELELLNRELKEIAGAAAAGARPVVTFTVFVPDERKAGGRYEDVTDAVKKVDPEGRRVVLMSAEGRGNGNRTIPFEHITAIRRAPEGEPDGE